jgi:hypothetical protein
MSLKSANLGRVGALRRPDAAARCPYDGAFLKDERD